MTCCNHDCDQGDTCPARNTIRYNTGWKRLDNVLSAIAYVATLSFAIAMALAVTAVIFGAGK